MQIGDGVVGRSALDRQRALAGRGQHLDRVEDLGDLVEPAEPGQPGAGEHDGVDLAVGDEARAGCRRCRGSATTSRPRPRARSWAARRGEPVPIREPAGQLAEGQPVAGDQRVARVLAQRHRGEHEALGLGGRQVLERVHGEVDLAGEQRVAQRARRRRRCRRSGPAPRVEVSP